jgi:hypothetical protein
MRNGHLIASHWSERAARARIDVPSESGDTWRWRVVWVLCVVAALGLQLRLIRAVAQRFVSEDQALLWSAARAWGHGQPREWTFWGQTYGTTLEAIGAEGFRWGGVPLRIGLPLTISLLNLSCWWALAAAAHRRKLTALALIALLVPVAASWRWSLVSAVFNTGAGRLAAVLSVAVALGARRTTWTVAFIVTLAGLAVQWDASTVIVLVPLAVMLLAERPGRAWWAVAPGAVIPVGWFVGARWFADNHPDRALHPAPPLEMSSAFLRHAWSTRNNLSHVMTPTWWLLPLALAVLTGLAVYRRRWSVVIGAMAVGATSVAILSTFRSNDGRPTPYFEQGRTVLALPFAIWLLWAMMSIERPTHAATGAIVSNASTPQGRALGWWWCIVPLVAFAAKFASYNSAMSSLTRGIESDAVYPVQRFDRIERDCATLRAAAQDERWVIVRADRTLAYGCDALTDGAVRPVFVEYERRTWWLHDLERVQPSSLAIWTPIAGACGAWSSMVDSCTPSPVDGRLVRITFGTRSWVDVLETIGVPVRPFGDHCRPQSGDRCR